MSLILIAAIALLLSFFNLCVSRHVCRDSRRTQEERIAEVGLIWLVPVFGGLVSLAISAERPERVRRSSGFFAGAAGAAETTTWTADASAP